MILLNLLPLFASGVVVLKLQSPRFEPLSAAVVEATVKAMSDMMVVVSAAAATVYLAITVLVLAGGVGTR
jgi:hypothetical protein